MLLTITRIVDRFYIDCLHIIVNYRICFNCLSCLFLRVRRGLPVGNVVQEHSGNTKDQMHMKKMVMFYENQHKGYFVNIS